MQNYQHPKIPEFFARIDKDGSYSVFLRGEKALEEVSKEELKHMGFHIEEERSHKIVMPIGTAGEDIKIGQFCQVCDRGVVMKYRHGKPVEQEEKRDRIDELYDDYADYKNASKADIQRRKTGFRQVIEKHMHKQKKFDKFDKFDIQNYITNKARGGGEYEPLLTFLRDHDLLDE